jgi:SAM-dependent methyltransferase
MRLKKPKSVTVEFCLEPEPQTDPQITNYPLLENPHPDVDFSKVKIPSHLSKEIMSYFPRAKSDNSLALDLGCGSAIHREALEYCGFEYIGLDNGNPKAPLQGDAHALPFADESIEFILSIAVLEHIQYPFLMMKETFRVLKPGGAFIGTVAFLEPFHLNSYYHHSHLGTYNSLNCTGFKIEQIAPNENWTGIIAMAGMGLFPGMPKRISRLLVQPVNLFHKAWWSIGSALRPKANRRSHARDITGSFTFLARKPATW